MTNTNIKVNEDQEPLPGRPEKIDHFLHDLAFRERIEKADLIFCIDEATGRQTIEFGRATLKGIIKSGKAQAINVVNIPLKADTLEYEALIAVILATKGYYDNEKRHRCSVDLGSFTAVMKNPREIH
jgi:hypothetical protein